MLIKGIVSRPELNACIGKVIGSFDSEKQAWPVRVVLEKGDIDRLVSHAYFTFPKAPQKKFF